MSCFVSERTSYLAFLRPPAVIPVNAFFANTLIEDSCMIESFLNDEVLIMLRQTRHWMLSHSNFCQHAGDGCKTLELCGYCLSLTDSVLPVETKHWQTLGLHCFWILPLCCSKPDVHHRSLLLWSNHVVRTIKLLNPNSRPDSSRHCGCTLPAVLFFMPSSISAGWIFRCWSSALSRSEFGWAIIFLVQTGYWRALHFAWKRSTGSSMSETSLIFQGNEATWAFIFYLAKRSSWKCRFGRKYFFQIVLCSTLFKHSFLLVSELCCPHKLLQRICLESKGC